MRHVVAVEHPARPLAGVERDDDTLVRGHMHRVTHRTGKPPIADLNHLESVPVQVHRVRHH